MGGGAFMLWLMKTTEPVLCDESPLASSSWTLMSLLCSCCPCPQASQPDFPALKVPSFLYVSSTSLNSHGKSAAQAMSRTEVMGSFNASLINSADQSPYQKRNYLIFP